MLRKYFPRTLTALEPFGDLPSYSGPSFGHYSVLPLAEALSTPEISGGIQKLARAGQLMREWRPRMEAFAQKLQKLGFPPFADNLSLAPFDAISDHLRGMKGSMLDMYRQPDILLEACTVMLRKMVDRIQPALPGTVNRVAIPLHRGSEGFMSIRQFEKFYWPGLKGLIMALIEKGHTPLVFFEGDYTSRLEYLLELPRGKVFAHMDTTDIVRAKQVLGGNLCFSGNMPCSLLQTGSVQEVRDYTTRMLDLCAKDGGFIMSSRSPVDDARPETLKAMIDTTLNYRY
jgi:uroporphyrinogen-III decarboxylase